VVHNVGVLHAEAPQSEFRQLRLLQRAGAGAEQRAGHGRFKRAFGRVRQTGADRRLRPHVLRTASALVPRDHADDRRDVIQLVRQAIEARTAAGRPLAESAES